MQHSRQGYRPRALLPGYSLPDAQVFRVLFKVQKKLEMASTSGDVSSTFPEK